MAYKWKTQTEYLAHIGAAAYLAGKKTIYIEHHRGIDQFMADLNDWASLLAEMQLYETCPHCHRAHVKEAAK